MSETKKRKQKEYKDRIRETYKGQRIDVKADDTITLAKKYAAKKAEIDKAELDKKKKLITPETTVIDYFEKYVTIYKTSVTKKEVEETRGRLRNYVYPIIGDFSMTDVKPIHIQEVMNGLVGMSSSLISKVKQILKQGFSQAEFDEIIDKDPTRKIQKIKSKIKEERRPLTEKERYYFLKFAEETERVSLRLYIKLMLYCGLRPQEAAGLTWDKIDLENRIIYIKNAVNTDDELGDTKTPAGVRKLPIAHDNLFEDLKKYKISGFGFVCTTTQGKMMTKSARKAAWKNVRRNINIMMGCKVFNNQLIKPFPLDPKITAYNLRHTYCTDLCAAGVDVKRAMEFMGHKDLSVTLSIYAHSSELAFEESTEAMMNYYTKLKERSDGIEKIIV